MRVNLPALVAGAIVAASRLPAQEHVHADAEQLGTVHFRTSCAPAVAPRFDRAVALLHSFEFGASLREFDAVLAADSSCAMAYWGIALNRWSNPMAIFTRAPDALSEGRRAADAGARVAARATARERQYLTAVARLYRDFEHVDQGTRVASYERAMADLVRAQPADTEAMIFHAIALTATADPSDKTYAKQLEAGAVLEALWRMLPDHPGLAHYIIHTYDVPALAPRAAAAAAKYAQIAPSAAHALHMPSHTFTRVGEWTESAETNRRSMQVAMDSRCIAEALHAADYRMYAYLQLAQDSAAAALLRQLPALASGFDPTAICGAAPGSAGIFALAAIPTRYALERRDWPAVVALSVPEQARRLPWAAAVVHFARALGAAHVGDLAAAQRDVDSLATIRDRLRASGDAYWSQQVAIQQLGALAWLERARGQSADALRHMTQAAAMEDSTEKSAVTPGPIAPARELLGDMLLEMQQPAEALAEYRRTLAKEPNRLRTLCGASAAARRTGATLPMQQPVGCS